ncbi:hypothetical protein [Prevotellamassilia timonensis]|uniref:hypothetical protein n=1 Tax=Prevotellamassilia timonensis TaxID=1852370 RepID=UPI00307F2478
MTIITIICVLIIAALFFGGLWYIAALIIGIPLAYGLHKLLMMFFADYFKKKLQKYCEKKGLKFDLDELPDD